MTSLIWMIRFAAWHSGCMTCRTVLFPLTPLSGAHPMRTLRKSFWLPVLLLLTVPTLSRAQTGSAHFTDDDPSCAPVKNLLGPLGGFKALQNLTIVPTGVPKIKTNAG